MKKALYILSGMLLVLGACNKQIDSIHPLTQIDQAGELAIPSGIIETTAGNYTLLRNYQFTGYGEPRINIGEGRGNNVTLEVFGPANKESDAFYFRNSTDALQGMSGDLFQGSFQLVVSVNVTLGGIAAMEASHYAGLSIDDKNAVIYAKGENLFLRALTYFNLARVYGKPYYQDNAGGPCVPIKTSADINDRPKVSTVKEVYDFVIKDLKEAAQDMTVPVTKSNTHASKYAAWALLSRVYLYMGGTVASPNAEFNQSAVMYADSVLAEIGGKYNLISGADYNKMFGDDLDGSLGKNVFDQTNPEIIFASEEGLSAIGGLFHTDNLYGVGGIFTPSKDFQSLLSPADIRNSFLEVNTGTNFIESTKSMCLNQAAYTMAPEIFLRTGEIYLNRAEAYAKLGMFAEAKADLKAIHMRAGLPGSDIDALPNSEVLDAVLLERRIELAFEGHAGFDYFRNGLSMSRLADDNNGTPLTVAPTDPKVVYPLPPY